LKSINELIAKLKSSNFKKKNILIIVLGFLSIFIIFISEFDSDNDNDKNVKANNDSSDYCAIIEQKIESFIESIDGAGETRVIVTISETTEYIYATDDKESKKLNDNSEDWTVENNYIIIKNSNVNSGLLIKTIEPKIRGVAIACEGGDDVDVQEQIISAVSAVLNINSSKISISKLSIKESENEK
jgi:stage III sporulation protein AG